MNVVAKAGGSIEVGDETASTLSLSTNGGDIVLWSNTGNKEYGLGEHYIEVGQNTSLLSGGGNIFLAGGFDNNGYPGGYAYNGGVSGGTSPFHPGLNLGTVGVPSGALITIDSGGGDIVL